MCTCDSIYEKCTAISIAFDVGSANVTVQSKMTYMLGGNMAGNKNRERFVDLAEKRVSRALKDIKLIGNLSNRTNYSYTDHDVKKIMQALNKALLETKARFDAKGAAAEEVFKL